MNGLSPEIVAIVFLLEHIGFAIVSLWFVSFFFLYLIDCSGS